MGTISQQLVELEFPRTFLEKQLEVMEAVKKFKCVLYSGAFRAGKTLLLAHIAITICIENPGVVGMLGSLTTPQLTDVVFAVFLQELARYQAVLDKAGVPITLAKIKRTKGDMKVEFWNGSLVMFKPCDDELKLRGLTLDFFGLDEPIDIDESIFLQLLGRISGTGNLKTCKPFGVLTTNPGSQGHWIYKYFFERQNPEFKCIETTTYENKLLPDYDNYIRRLEENYDDDWVRRYLDGKWGAFSGQIYKGFNPARDVGAYEAYRPGKERSEEVRYYVAGVDWGIRNPSCILALAVLTNKTIVVVEEYYVSGKTSVDIAKKISAFHKHYKFKQVYCDPSAKDLIAQTSDLGVPIDKANNDVAGGIGKIKSLFKKQALKIDKTCYNLIRELQIYRYAKDRMNKNLTEDPVKQDDHAPDALRYALTGFRAFVGKLSMAWGRSLYWSY